MTGARERLEAICGEKEVEGFDFAMVATPDLRVLLAENAALRELEQKIERVLSYKGPKWSDEMSLREKAAYEFTGDINGTVSDFRRARAVLKGEFSSDGGTDDRQ